MADDAQEEVREEKQGKTTGHKMSIVGEFFVFLKYNKKWWLIPILTIFLLLGFLIAVTSQSAWAPFIYALF